MLRKSPMSKLSKQLQNDPEYAWSWHCNVAVHMMDAGLSHKKSNKIAARFMYSIFGVNIKLNPNWAY